MPKWRLETWIVLINVALWIFLGYYVLSSQEFLSVPYAEGAITYAFLLVLLALGAIVSIGSLAFFWRRSRPKERG